MLNRYKAQAKRWLTAARRKRAARAPQRRRVSSAPMVRRIGTTYTRIPTFRPRYATVGFNRDVEKKYSDKCLASLATQSSIVGPSERSSESGAMFRSITWRANDFYQEGADKTEVTNNLYAGLGQGTTATTRIGNKITPVYIKGAMTFSSALQNTPRTETWEQGGEIVANPAQTATINQYLRTTFRVCIVKDLQVNSQDQRIMWSDVFEHNAGNAGVEGGIHSELRISNMGRFRVLKDHQFELSAIRPQKTLRFMLPARVLNPVRYNGPAGNALTDSGIYVIWAAYVHGVQANVSITDGIAIPFVDMHSRLCFTDA